MSIRSAIPGTPASERSIYFDAPMMHITTGDSPAPGRAGSVRSRAPSVSIPKSPVTNTQPAPRAVYGDDSDQEEHGVGSSDEEEDRELRPGPDPFDDDRGSRLRARTKRTSISGFSYTSGRSKPSAFSRRRAKSVPRASSPADDSSACGAHSAESAPASGVKAKSTLKKRASIRSGVFSAGPGTIGPAISPEPDLSMHARERTAESVLTPKQKSKITKEELKEGKRLSKIIQTEQKAERAALDIAMKELAELTKLQKAAMKDESRAHTAHATTLKSFHKTELAFLAARAKYESALTDLRNTEEGLEKTRKHAEMVTDMVREKMREVEELRGMKRVDDRERMVKVSELKGKLPAEA
ncbi:hypothetical protein GLOTRDRAFT_140435 [Gloeophyllum trabeum ATCC 11539]|uniref:Uncharacterized protein n=1 Tax=Gloeophyllum trabeum (strain ATCC 11539 / FP-39264 / Madison 617) TaxID=670483 RepID=S7RJL6_GLOTA|nr:uncharacterized protein GLOTRDRAFT_140435 [Gloeophyllum trabeum ATCC 11539]EPQ52829.1 hypothetical protein GLOTRDRAFT_140435 [Gloeophyllum trabeum ATCC 11539]